MLDELIDADRQVVPAALEPGEADRESRGQLMIDADVVLKVVVALLVRVGDAVVAERRHHRTDFVVLGDVVVVAGAPICAGSQVDVPGRNAQSDQLRVSLLSAIGSYGAVAFTA